MRHVIPQQPYLCRRHACQVITTWRLLKVIACNLCEVIAIYSAPKIIITKKNCERFKCYAGIDPYSVSANFFPWSMDKWSEVEFPDMVNYFHFSTSKLVKNTSKPTNVFSPTKTSLLMVWEVSLWEKWPQIVNTLQDDGSKKCNLQNSASSRLKLRLLLFVLHRKICLVQDFGLFDFRVDVEGNPFFLECNLFCSFGPRSVVNIVAKDSGFTDESLFDMMVENTLLRKRKQENNNVNLW